MTLGMVIPPFLDTIPKIQSMKDWIDKLTFIKITNFCSAKDNVMRMWNPQSGRKYLQKEHLIKDSYPKYKKNSYNSTIRNQNMWFKKCARNLNKNLTREDLLMANNHKKMLPPYHMSSCKHTLKQWDTTTCLLKSQNLEHWQY